MLKKISSIILKCWGWNTNVHFPNTCKKAVVIVGPHTSGWDVVIGVLYRSYLNVTTIKFLGKMELFKPPFGFFFKWLGGFPIDRFNKHQSVLQIVEVFKKEKEFMLALSPEGTRKKVDKLRTGFYYIAKGADVPIIMIGLDFKNKTLQITEPFFLSDEEEEDMRKIINFFAPIQGKISEYGMSHLKNW